MACAAWLAPSAVLGAPDTPATGAAPRAKVLVLPVQHFVEGVEGIDAVGTWLLAGLSGHPSLEAVPPSALPQAISRTHLYAERLALARDNLRAGVADHERMRLVAAVGRLEEARKLFDQTLQRWVEPAEVAESLLTLALAYLESGRADRAHLAFKALLSIDPGRALRAGYYSKRAIKAFGVAQTDFSNQADMSIAPDQGAALAQTVGARFVLSTHVRGRARGGTALVATLLDAASKRVLDRESVPADPASLPWQVDRLVSRLVACVSPDRAVAARREPYPGGRWYVGTTIDSVAYAARPAREAFLSFGASMRADYLLSPHLVATGRLGFSRSTALTLTSEGFEDLRTPLDTVRMFSSVGPRFATGGGRGVDAYLVAGVEIVLPSAVRHTQDAGCKWGPPYVCGAQRQDPAWLVGPAAAAGIAWSAFGPIAVQLETSTAYYILSGGANELNLPFRLSVGLGYRF